MFALPQRFDDQAGAVRHEDHGLMHWRAFRVADSDVRVRQAEHAEHLLRVLLSLLRHRGGGCRAGVRDWPRVEVLNIRGPDGLTSPRSPEMFLLVGAPDQRGGVGPSWLLPFVCGADGVYQDGYRPGVRRHIVGLGGLLLPIDMGPEGPFAWRCHAGRSTGLRSGSATGSPRRGRAGWPGSPPPVAPVLPLAGLWGRAAAACVPDAGALAERGVPQAGRVVLGPLYATRDLRWAVVVDKAFPNVRQQRRRNDVQLPRREGRRWAVRRGCLTLSRIPAGDVGQQARRPRRHGSHSDGRPRECQCRAVRRPVLLKSRGVLGELLAGRGLVHRPTVRAVQFGPVRVAASPLLHRSGRVERGSLQQCLLALPWQEGGGGRLREALCAEALRVRVVRVLLAVLQGRLREEE